MATWQLIEHTSKTLVRVIRDHVHAAWSPTVQVRLATPHAFADLKAAKPATISVFLYRVVENPELRNTSPRRIPASAAQPMRVQRQPMALELCYLITPWGVRTGDSSDEKAAEEEQKLYGLILQALYDHAELSRAELSDDPLHSVWDQTDAVQVIHESLPVEDLYRIWDASELSYHLSATYRVRVLGLDASQQRAVSPVVEASFELQRDEHLGGAR